MFIFHFLATLQLKVFHSFLKQFFAPLQSFRSLCVCNMYKKDFMATVKIILTVWSPYSIESTSGWLFWSPQDTHHYQVNAGHCEVRMSKVACILATEERMGYPKLLSVSEVTIVVDEDCDISITMFCCMCQIYGMCYKAIPLKCRFAPLTQLFTEIHSATASLFS